MDKKIGSRLTGYTCVFQQPYARQFITLIDLAASVALCTCRVTPSTKAFTTTSLIQLLSYSSIINFFLLHFRSHALIFIIHFCLNVYIWMLPMLLGSVYSQSYSLREAISCMYVYLVIRGTNCASESAVYAFVCPSVRPSQLKGRLVMIPMGLSSK